MTQPKSLTATLFDFIKANPTISRKEATAAMVSQGFNYVSVVAMVSKFVTRGHVIDTGGSLTVAEEEYKPRSQPAGTARRAHATPTIVEEVVVPEVVLPWSAADHVDSLTLRQARAVYEELRTVFGS